MSCLRPFDRIELVRGDITSQEVDVIVNAANETLLGGGGVDGAIHRAAGPELLAECRTLGGCSTGMAKITRGHRLSASHVIHTVGPVYGGGDRGEAAKLASCYSESLKLAADCGCRSVAFPAISCGVYGYPIAAAARVSIETVLSFLARSPLPDRVRWVLFSEGDYVAYQGALSAFAD